MEHEFSKEQILSTYLNVIFLGQRSYGVAAAAETYFGKPLDQLSVAEAATLAGIPQAPSRYNPITNPQGARRRGVATCCSRCRSSTTSMPPRRSAPAPKQVAGARSRHPHYDVEAPYVAEMARAGDRQPLRRRCGQRGLPGLHHHRRPPADRRRSRGAPRPDRIRPPPWLSRPAAAREARCRRQPRRSSMRCCRASAEVGDPAAGGGGLGGAEGRARLHPRQGFAQIDWDGLSWARGACPIPAPVAAEACRRSPAARRCGLRGQRRQGQRRSWPQLPEAQGAMVALDPDDGAIIALVGGFDYFNNKFNRVDAGAPPAGLRLQALPVLRGARARLHGRLDHHGCADRVRRQRPGEDLAAEEQREGLQRADAPARGAGAFAQSSVDPPAAQLGVDAAINYAAQFGFDPATCPSDMTLALGTLQVTPIQMVTGYATFANGGYQVEPYFIDRIEDASGRCCIGPIPSRLRELRCRRRAGGGAGRRRRSTATPATAAQRQQHRRRAARCRRATPAATTDRSTGRSARRRSCRRPIAAARDFAAERLDHG